MFHASYRARAANVVPHNYRDHSVVARKPASPATVVAVADQQ